MRRNSRDGRRSLRHRAMRLCISWLHRMDGLAEGLLEMKPIFEYLFVLRTSLRGYYVSSWHQLTGDEGTDKGAMFGMGIASRMNMGSGILKVNCTEEWTPELLELHIKRMSIDKVQEFIEECKV